MYNFNKLFLLGKIQKIINSAKKEATFLIDFTDSNNNHHCIPIYVAEFIVDKTKEYCTLNDVITIKGSISTNKNNNIINEDKITFLSSSKQLKKLVFDYGLILLLKTITINN